MGLVSPQFHVKFDANFASVQYERSKKHSMWQLKAGFIQPKVVPASTNTPKHQPHRENASEWNLSKVPEGAGRAPECVQ